MASTIPVELRELLKRGEYLSMFPAGKKPNMNDFTFVDASSYLGALYRMLHGENRRGMILEINSIIDQFITALKNYSDTEFLPMIVDTLSRVKNGGLINLARTYSEAPDTSADLRVCIANIDLQLLKYKHLIRGYKAAERMEPVLTELTNSTPSGAVSFPSATTKMAGKTKGKGDNVDV